MQILGDEDRQAIDDALEILKELKTQVIKAQQAKVEVPTSQEELKELEGRLLAIRQTYFPRR